MCVMTAQQIVADLQSGNARQQARAARALDRLCRPAITAQVAQRVAGAGRRANQLVDFLIRFATEWLRHVPGHTIQAQDVLRGGLPALAYCVGVRTEHVVRALVPVPGASRVRPRGPAADPQPRGAGWQVYLDLRQCEPVGGDWIGFDRADDGSLWVLVADATGHGLAAYTLGAFLPALWRSRHVAPFRNRGESPEQILGRLHRELQQTAGLTDRLVEATVARLTPQGDVQIAFAGGQALLDRVAGVAKLRRPGGTWLGATWTPGSFGTCDLSVPPGGELLVCSDGVLEQPCRWYGWLWWLPGVRWWVRRKPADRRRRPQVVDLFAGWCPHAIPARPLDRVIARLLWRVLRVHDQTDDLSWVVARR